MDMIAALLHYLGIMICLAFAASGVALGQGIAGGTAIQSLSRQELSLSPIRRALLVGMAFLESGSIFALVASFIYLFNMPFEPTVASGLAVLGAGIAMGISACVVGVASGRVVAAASQAMARQPLQAHKITSLMTLTQMLLEAPAVFAFILCFLVRSKLTPDMSIGFGVQLCLAGIVLGMSSIGPAIGQSIFAANACQAVGLNIDMFARIFSFSFIIQAIIETPIIFALLLSLGMVMMPLGHVALSTLVPALVGATCAFGLGSLGAAIGSGVVAARSVAGMVAEPSQYTVLVRTTLICTAVIDTALIYSFIIAVFLFRSCM